MIRVLNLMAVMAVILSSFGLYRVKQEALVEAHQVAEIRREIAREEDTIDVLKAEWSYLNRPSKVQELAENYLDLKPIDAGQIVTIQDLPPRSREQDPYGGTSGAYGGFAGGEVTGTIR